MDDLIERKYLIKKGGYWYRPNCRGYTDSAISAGRYTLDEAVRYTHPNGKDGPRDGMTFSHEDDLVCPDWLRLRKAEARLAEVETERDRLRVMLNRAVSGEAHAVRNEMISKVIEEFNVKVAGMTRDEARAALGAKP